MEVGDKDERAELECWVKEERDVNASVTFHSCQTHVSMSSGDRACALVASASSRPKVLLNVRWLEQLLTKQTNQKLHIK